MKVLGQFFNKIVALNFKVGFLKESVNWYLFPDGSGIMLFGYIFSIVRFVLLVGCFRHSKLSLKVSYVCGMVDNPSDWIVFPKNCFS